MDTLPAEPSILANLQPERTPGDRFLPAVSALLKASFYGTIAGWIAQAACGALAADQGSGPIAFFSLLGLGFLAFGFFLAFSLCFSLPVLLCVWLPLWLLRGRLRFFWNGSLAPILGGIAGLGFISVPLLLFHTDRIFLDAGQLANPLGIAFFVGGLVGGIVMFRTGTYYFRDPRFDSRPVIQLLSANGAADATDTTSPLAK